MPLVGLYLNDETFWQALDLPNPLPAVYVVPIAPQFNFTGDGGAPNPLSVMTATFRTRSSHFKYALHLESKPPSGKAWYFGENKVQLLSVPPTPRG